MCAVVTLEVGAIILPRALISLSRDMADKNQVRLSDDRSSASDVPGSPAKFAQLMCFLFEFHSV